MSPGWVSGTPLNQLAFSASGSPTLIGQLSASMGHGLLGIHRHRKGSGAHGYRSQLAVRLVAAD